MSSSKATPAPSDSQEAPPPSPSATKNPQMQAAGTGLASTNYASSSSPITSTAANTLISSDRTATSSGLEALDRFENGLKAKMAEADKGGKWGKPSGGAVTFRD